MRVNDGKEVWVRAIFSAQGRDALSDQAKKSRADARNRRLAWILVIFYNIIGLLDIASTEIAISAGVGEEANPVMRAAMENFGPAWMAAKLILQLLISYMVWWFPHRFVIAMFFVAVAWNTLVVGNNFSIVLSG